jgi:hypothetical protein
MSQNEQNSLSEGISREFKDMRSWAECTNSSDDATVANLINESTARLNDSSTSEEKNLESEHSERDNLFNLTASDVKTYLKIANVKLKHLQDIENLRLIKIKIHKLQNNLWDNSNLSRMNTSTLNCQRDDLTSTFSTIKDMSDKCYWHQKLIDLDMSKTSTYKTNKKFFAIDMKQFEKFVITFTMFHHHNFNYFYNHDYYKILETVTHLNMNITTKWHKHSTQMKNLLS